METKKTKHENCCADVRGGSIRRKKIVIGFILFLAAIAVLFSTVAAAKMKLREEFNRASAGMQGSNAAVVMYPSPYNPYDDSTQFVLPQDASKNGEILLQVANVADVSKKIGDVVSANGGVVYATYTSYTQNRFGGNGFVVIQVGEDKFDSTYSSLKALGSKVLQESTKNIPRYDYAVPMSATATLEKPTDTAPSTESANNNSSETAVAQPTIAPAPQPAFQQNKGYVKVNFVEVVAQNRRGYEKNEAVSAWLKYEGMGFRNNVVMVLGIKLIAVVALIFIIIILVAKLIRHDRQRRDAKKKPTVHIVRQQAKPRARVVRTARKK